MDADGEREQALRDPLCESGRGFREVVAESHLAFQVREHRLDHEPDACFCDLRRWSFAEPVFVRGDELDLDQLHLLAIVGAPEAAVAVERGSGVSGSAFEHRLAFVTLLGIDKVVADRNALTITDQHQPHTPQVLAFRGAV